MLYSAAVPLPKAADEAETVAPPEDTSSATDIAQAANAAVRRNVHCFVFRVWL